ncbi:hypothetical protein MTR67_020429, partial [Solanum verrucosum]
AELRKTDTTASNHGLDQHNTLGFKTKELQLLHKKDFLQPMELQFGGESDNLPQLTLSRVQLSTASLLLPALHQSSLVPVDHYAPTVPPLAPHYVVLLFFLYCPALWCY